MMNLQTRENGFQDTLSSLFNDVSQSAKKEVSSATQRVVNEATPLLNNASVAIVNALINAIPEEKELEALATQFSNFVIQLLDENVLPQLYSEVRDAKLAGIPITDDKIKEIQKKILANIPANMKFTVMGVNITISPKSALATALPTRKIKQVIEKLEPFYETVQAQVLPAVEKKAKQVVGLIAVSSFVAGGLLTFGYVKLYQSAKSSNLKLL